MVLCFFYLAGFPTPGGFPPLTKQGRWAEGNGLLLLFAPCFRCAFKGGIEVSNLQELFWVNC